MMHQAPRPDDQRNRGEPSVPRNLSSFWRSLRGNRLLLALASGAALGWLAALGCATHRKGPDFALMAEAWSLMNKEYVDRAALKPADLTYGAIGGMIDALGDTEHSTFLTPEMVKNLKNTERGEFKGIGVEIQEKDGNLVVVAPFDDSPAQKAGVRAGDVIVKVFDDDIADWPLGKVVEKITGPVGTPVSLTVRDPRSGHTRRLTLVRADIKVHEVTWQRLPGTTAAHLRLAGFDSGATRDLRKALAELRQEGSKGIILDLRNNPGGFLDEAVSVASQFLTNGNVLEVKDAKGRVKPVEVEKGAICPDLPLVVLVNSGSASAAEIVAGALRDNHRATLVGEKTFGTGTVLGQFRLSDGSALLLAVEEWLTPNGQSFWHKGIVPQVAVPLPDEADPLLPVNERDLTAAQFQAVSDKQLLRALALLK
jgi:carboxyl-terminal processing protease